jgi:hypothetical protein
MHYFAKPPLPDSVLILAGGEGEDFALCELDDVYGLTVQPVSEEAERLVTAAKAWPPAMALAAAAVEKMEDVTSDASMFETILCELLPWFLALREQGKCILAKCIVSEPDYRNEGEQLWIVAKRDNDVLWISSDYQIYDAPAADFELSAEDLRALPQRVPLPKWLASRGSN